MKKIVASVITCSFLLMSTSSVFAARHGVLGASTSDLSVPPTVEGPGFILPDSPFYFLDSVKQEVRLFLAFNSENKAKVHADVAGERMAELRVMLAKNNQTGAVKALEGIATNLQSAANDLEDAKLQGKDTSKTAEVINEMIKQKQDSLDALEDQAGDILKARVRVVQETLKDAKLGVNASLPGDRMSQELEEDINREIADHVKDASQSAVSLEHSLDILNKLAREAEDKNQSEKVAALNKAIAEKNELLTKEKQKELNAQTEKSQKTIKVTADEAAAARETVHAAQEAAAKFRLAQEAKAALHRNLTPTPTSHSDHKESNTSHRPAVEPTHESESTDHGESEDK